MTTPPGTRHEVLALEPGLLDERRSPMPVMRPPIRAPERRGLLVECNWQLVRAAVIGIASEANHHWLRSAGVIPVAYGDGMAERIKSSGKSGCRRVRRHLRIGSAGTMSRRRVALTCCAGVETKELFAEEAPRYRWLNPVDSSLDMGTVTGCLPKCAMASRKSSSSREAMSRLTPQADQDALHRDVGGCPGQGVGRHLPALGCQPVGQVEQGVAGVRAVTDPPGDRRDSRVRVAVTQELERAQLDDLGDEVLADLVGRIVDAPVSLITQAEEVVVLNDDLPGRAGEVDLEHRHVAAQVVDVEHQIVGEFLAVPPDDPADAKRGEPELCAPRC